MSMIARDGFSSRWRVRFDGGEKVQQRALISLLVNKGSIDQMGVGHRNPLIAANALLNETHVRGGLGVLRRFQAFQLT